MQVGIITPFPVGEGLGMGSEAASPRVGAVVEPPPQPLPSGEGLDGFQSMGFGITERVQTKRLRPGISLPGLYRQNTDRYPVGVNSHTIWPASSSLLQGTS